MTKEILVMARFKGGDPESPRFTQSTTVEKLMSAIAEKLPVDMIYYMLPDEDGSGYSLRAAGLVTLDVIPSEGLVAYPGAGHQTPAPQPAAQAAVLEQGEDFLDESIPEVAEAQDRPMVTKPAVDEPEDADEEEAPPPPKRRPAKFEGFGPAPIKSQKQLLAERGQAVIVQESIDDSGRKVLTEQIVSKKRAKKQAKAKSADARVAEQPRQAVANT